MDIKAITPTLLPSAEVTQVSLPSAKTPVPTQSGTSKDSISLGASVSNKTGKLSFISDNSNSIALRAKDTDQKLSTLADSIDKMKGVLEGIVKNYPPFSLESSERKGLLMSYSSIRKELLQLTIPKPPIPVYEKIQHQWQELFQNKASLSTIKLPGELGSATPDSDLNTTIADLTTLHNGITSVRSDIKQSLLRK